MKKIELTDELYEELHEIVVGRYEMLDAELAEHTQKWATAVATGDSKAQEFHEKPIAQLTKILEELAPLANAVMNAETVR